MRRCVLQHTLTLNQSTAGDFFSALCRVQILYLVLLDSAVTNCRFCVNRNPIDAGIYQLLGVNALWFFSALIKVSIEGCARHARPRGRCREVCAAFFEAPEHALRVPWFQFFTPFAQTLNYAEGAAASASEAAAALSTAFGGGHACVGPAVAGIKADRSRPGHRFLGPDGRAVWGSPPLSAPVVEWALSLAKLWTKVAATSAAAATDRAAVSPVTGAGVSTSSDPATGDAKSTLSDAASQVVRMHVAAGRAVLTRAALAQVSCLGGGEGGHLA